MVSVSGSQLQINPSSPLDDRGSKRWNVSIPAGAVTDLVGDSYGGFALDMYSFTLDDSTGPVLLDHSPSNGQMYVAKDTDITLQFDEPVVLSGSVILTPNNGGSPVVFTSSSPEVNVTDSFIRISPLTPLDPGVTWTFSFVAGAVKDTDTTPNPVLASSSAFATRVSVIASLPENDDVDAMRMTRIQLTLDANISVGAGNVILTPTDLVYN